MRAVERLADRIGGAGAECGMDLSQMLSRLPTETLAGLKREMR